MKKAVVVDFDLTLVKVNSFELFYKELAKYTLKKRRLGLLAFLVYQIIQRKSRLISHARLKRNTLLYLDNIDIEAFITSFTNLLMKFLAVDVVGTIDYYRNKGYGIFLSTAAPQLYIDSFLDKSKLVFDGVICSTKPEKGKEWKENLNENKKVMTIATLKKNDYCLSVLITDHRDDLPLLKIPKERNIVVRPTDKTIKKLKDEEIDYVLI